MRNNLGVILTSLVLTLCSVGQVTHVAKRYNVVKAQNGLFVGWLVASEDREMNQIDVYDNKGDLLVGLDLLRLVPEAKRATVRDVSVRPGGVIAVAAVYRKDDGTIPAATLLSFDFKGNLLLSLALAPSRSAWRVAVDSESNIWTLTAGAADIDPTKAPLVVAYTPSGSVLREVLKRSEFPLHAKDTLENSQVGTPAFGYNSKGVWLWLPGSSDEVTFNTDGSSVERTVTGLPEQMKDGKAQRVVLTENGGLLAQIWPKEHPKTPQASFFFRSAATRAWALSYPPCSSCTLIGADARSAFFIKGVQNGSEIYAAPLPE